MRINIVIPPQLPHAFSGGSLCLLNYAQGLALRGHAVNVVASHASAQPLWFPGPWAFRFVAPGLRPLVGQAVRESARGLGELARSALAGRPRLTPQAIAPLRRALQAISGAAGQYAQAGAFVGAGLDNLARVLPEADVTLATSHETAYAVALLGKGRLYSFAQHYEPLFWRESAWGETARRQAELSYGLGLRQIANSPWLAAQLAERHGLHHVPVCASAIDHRAFAGQPRRRPDVNVLDIISYGGREARWKGMQEMAEGVRLARQRHPGIRFQWRVYGSSLLPPDNPVAPYEALGFLDQPALAQAYGRHDVLLSASWYESFPLFPLEAMACGLAAVCTLPGAEAFARHGDTAHVVPPQSPEAIADALGRLAQDEDYRLALAGAGQAAAREFTWERAVARMEQLLAC